jgi:hypothetical protein
VNEKVQLFPNPHRPKKQLSSLNLGLCIGQKVEIVDTENKSRRKAALQASGVGVVWFNKNPNYLEKEKETSITEQQGCH